MRQNVRRVRQNMAVSAALWILLALFCLATTPVITENLPKVEAFFQGKLIYILIIYPHHLGSILEATWLLFTPLYLL